MERPSYVRFAFLPQRAQMQPRGFLCGGLQKLSSASSLAQYNQDSIHELVIERVKSFEENISQYCLNWFIRVISFPEVFLHICVTNAGVPTNSEK